MSANAAEARPEFYDPELQQALEESSVAIESFTTKLDRLSSDIKALEAYLERSAVRVDTQVEFPGGAGGPSRYLRWTRGEPDRWRIVYVEAARNHSGWTEDTGSCVLIEAPLEVRVKARAVLPLLLREVAKVALLGERPDDDIPF